MKTEPTWLKEPDLQQLFAATKAAGGEARAVGGAVRDWLMDKDGGDVDVASTLLPERTMEIAAENGWKAIPTGIDHGTVTLVLPERIVEVTTLRRDVETDGRHATVAFTDDWKEDAARRDFTINALSMDADGKVFDYYDGKNDIAAQRVAFIGDAATRITEDALRILRYFRFLASHGKPPADEAALGAITEKKEMIAGLSGERIANEMRKLLSVENPAYSLRLMKQTGIAPLVFGRDIEPQSIIRLHLLEAQADYQTSVWARVALLTMPSPGIAKPIPTSPEGRGHVAASECANGEAGEPLPSGEVGAQLGATGEGMEVAQWMVSRWKLSRHEASQLKLLAGLPKFDAKAPKHFHTRLLRLQHAPAYLDWLLVQAALTPGIDVAPYVALALDFVAPIFPVTAKDLMAKGMQEGKALGDALAVLEKRWEESDYTLTKDELLK